MKFFVSAAHFLLERRPCNVALILYRYWSGYSFSPHFSWYSLWFLYDSFSGRCCSCGLQCCGGSSTADCPRTGETKIWVSQKYSPQSKRVEIRSLLYSENREVWRLITEKIKKIPLNYDKEQRQKICSDSRLVRKVFVAECQKAHQQKSEFNAFPYTQGISMHSREQKMIT